MIAAALAFVHFRETPPERQHIRFQIAPPEGTLRDFKLSPDGRFLAFATFDGSAAKLWIRALDSLETRLLTSFPLGDPHLFWSADGEYVGFAASGKMYKIARTGGSSVAICDLPGAFRGAAWRSDGTILFGSSGRTVSRFLLGRHSRQDQRRDRRCSRVADGGKVSFPGAGQMGFSPAP